MTSTTSTTTDAVITDDAPVTYEKGSWQEHLDKSAKMLDRSTKARKAASSLLWQGAQEAVESWMPNASTDAGAEGLYAEVLGILGTPRKGDASKIKTVALAVRNNGLILASYPNLSKAYAEATRLTKTVAQEADEDNEADKAIESIVAPASTTTVDGAAAILLSKGLDGAVVAILDALGANNEAAHRAFMRAVSTEIAARVQAAKPKPAPKAAPKAGATQAKVGTAATKAKPASAKPKAESKSKGDPNKRMQPAKAKPAAKTVEAEPVTEPVHVGDDIPDHAEPVAAEPVKKTTVKRAVPVRRRANA